MGFERQKTDQKILAEQLTNEELSKAYTQIQELKLLSKELSCHHLEAFSSAFFYEMKERGLFDAMAGVD